MNIVIIGSGNVATVMGGRIMEAGHTILQVVARREEPAARLAAALHSGYTIRWAETSPDADLYIVAVSDTALVGLGAELSFPGKLVVHTAGAVRTDVLLPVSTSCGVLYPLQSLRSEIRPFPAFPLLIAAHRTEDLPLIESFARTISPQVQVADDSTRLRLHTAAIFVNNFTNYLYTRAALFCKEEGLDFSLLLPLIRETAERVERIAPSQMQTGPAVRGDKATIERHLDILHNHKDLTELYKLFTIQIERFYAVGENPAG